MPSVLSETVLPPVLGPVMTIVRIPRGTAMSIGTIALALGASPTSRQTISGWRSQGNASPASWTSLNVGGTARILALYRARAAARSTRVIAACRSGSTQQRVTAWNSTDHHQQATALAARDSTQQHVKRK